jgi:hypothetical protein
MIVFQLDLLVVLAGFNTQSGWTAKVRDRKGALASTRGTCAPEKATRS